MKYIPILFALFLGSLSAAAQSDEVDNTERYF